MPVSLMLVLMGIDTLFEKSDPSVRTLVLDALFRGL